MGHLPCICGNLPEAVKTRQSPSLGKDIEFWNILEKMNGVNGAFLNGNYLYLEFTEQYIREIKNDLVYGDVLEDDRELIEYQSIREGFPPHSYIQNLL